MTQTASQPTPPSASPEPAVLTPCPPPREGAVPSPAEPVDADWRQWVAENRLRHCSPASMAATMTAAGVDGAQAAQVIATIESDPVYPAALKMRQLRDKLGSVMLNLQKLRQLDPLYGHVEKRSRVSRDEFLQRYVIGNRPVVLTDVTHDWPAMQRWSPADLRQRFGHLEVEIQAERAADARYEMNKMTHRRTVRLADFVDRVLATGESNDEYLTANNGLLRRPEFAPLLDDIGSLPDICDGAPQPGRASLWFGPAGTVTPLHHDARMLFHTQVVGRKRWRLVSPLEAPRLYNHFAVFSEVNLDAVDLARHPDFAEVTVLDVVVEPGETMFLPLAWWHQVTSLDVSMSFSFSNLAVPNHFEFRNPQITNW